MLKAREQRTVKHSADDVIVIAGVGRQIKILQLAERIGANNATGLERVVVRHKSGKSGVVVINLCCEFVFSIPQFLVSVKHVPLLVVHLLEPIGESLIVPCQTVPIRVAKDEVERYLPNYGSTNGESLQSASERSGRTQ